MPSKKQFLMWLFIYGLILCLELNQILSRTLQIKFGEETTVVQQADILYKFDNQQHFQPTSKILKEINGDICNKHGYQQVDIQYCIEILYRQHIDKKLSLLKQNINNSGSNLNDVIAAIDDLQMIEMQNYHVADYQLSSVLPNQYNSVFLETKTAIFHSIILDKQAAIIVNLPHKYQKFKWIDIDNQALREEVNKFRIGLENYGDITYNPQQAQKVYDLIIRPFVNDLESLQIKTLVFIPDGILRSVPMAALHDGEKFLIEKYAIATTPSLSLTNLQISSKKMRALVVGLTKNAKVEGCKCEALSHVAAEIRQVQQQIPDSKQLLDENFTRDRLESELHQSFYPIIHIATHGEFGQLADDTFLVTGDNQKLTITELTRILRSLNHENKTIDLLMLTACESAIGKDNAVFGFAGVAVQAGVKTAIAPLWLINDAATVNLVTKFYEAWCHSGVSKAEALRIAQRSLIASDGAFSHPAYWAAFILVGNWF
ncbi:CHAT domain-containing protein [Nostoc sp. CCY 9925]|uniref:CHAT domain-containing protein n=1 Tax=Nostoc sp. CCY 9925 TaxID=3103865 RepID=UPI0039C5D23A